MPSPAPDPTIQTSYVFHCVHGAAEERPRGIADPRLKDTRNYARQQKDTRCPDCHLCDPWERVFPGEKSGRFVGTNVTSQARKQSFYRARHPRPTRSRVPMPYTSDSANLYRIET